MRTTARRILLFAANAAFGALVGGVVFYVLFLEARPDLGPWHFADLDEEFNAERAADVRTIADYQALEERLFRELDREVYAKVQLSTTQGLLNRFSRASLADPTHYPRNWNRSFELAPDGSPQGLALLLHGLSDSPYSLLSLAQVLRDRGLHVLALRLPGHGTAPAGLVRVDWRDFTAAVRLAASDLSRRFGTKLPLVLVGYSNGAALAVHYTLDSLEHAELPRPAGLVLLSPAMAVTRFAALAVWQARLGTLMELDKLAWNSIQPEFDPYKYNSFAVNAGEQIFRLTNAIGERLSNLARNGPVRDFPRVLAFQSAADATIPAGSVVDVLLGRLAPERHALVLFDINRYAMAHPFLTPQAGRLSAELLDGPPQPFDLTVVSNEHPKTERLVARHRAAGTQAAPGETLGLSWPRGVFSLSHVALPIRPDDPVYGARGHDVDDSGGPIHLGQLEIRGERGVLTLPLDQLNRLRYNPFFEYLERRTRAMVDELLRP